MGAVPPVRSERLRVFALSLYGPQAASHRVRLSQFQPGLAAAGIDLQIQSLLDDAYLQRRFAGARPSLFALLLAYRRRLRALAAGRRADLTIVYAELLPLLPAWLEHRLLRRPYLYDFDDAFFLKYRLARLRWLQPLLGRKIDRLIAGAAAVTAGNDHLASYARRFNANVTLLPSVVDTDHYIPAAQSPAHQATADQDTADQATVDQGIQAAPFTVGWIGSPSTAPYLELLRHPLQQLATERPVRLMVVGAAAPSIPGVEVIEHPWSLEREVALIQQFDVGVMPLPDTPWARGKCAYKLIQCLACAIPVVASAVGANREVVPPSCGRLADTPQQWLAALRELAADPSLRQHLGAAGRRWVEQRYSLRTALPLLERVIRGAISQPPAP